MLQIGYMIKMDYNYVPVNNVQLQRQNTECIEINQNNQLPTVTNSESWNESKLLHNENPPLSLELSSSMPEQREEEKQPKQIKKKRVRKDFSSRQVLRMESEFSKNKYPGLETRKELAAELDLNERHVLVWFQNRRQKIKHQLKANSRQLTHIKVRDVHTKRNVRSCTVKRPFTQGTETDKSNFFTSHLSQGRSSSARNESLNLTTPSSLLEEYYKELEIHASFNKSLSNSYSLLSEFNSNCPMQATQSNSIGFTKDLVYQDYNPTRKGSADIWIGSNWPNTNQENIEPDPFLSNSSVYEID